jgi:hypothetical protein
MTEGFDKGVLNGLVGFGHVPQVLIRNS